MAEGPGNILIKIGAEAGQAISELSSLNNSLGSTMTTSEKVGAGLHKAMLPATIALGALADGAVEATKAAIEQEAASDRLAHQLERTTGATDKQVDSAEEFVKQLSLATGVSRDELEPALGRLATATHSVSGAQNDLKLAMDISAQTGKSLDAVSSALAKGYSGNTGAISRLIPGLDKATLATKNMHDITGELAELTQGAAAESADTAAGRYKVWQNQMHELQVSIGEGLIPIVQSLMGVLEAATGFMTDHTTATKILIGTVAALAAGIVIANAAIKAYNIMQTVITASTRVWTAAQEALDGALDDNPIGIVVIALAALGVALIEAYKHSQTFRDIVQDALNDVLVVVRALERGFESARDAIGAGLNALEAAARAVGRAFDAVLAGAQSAFNWIVAHWQIGLFALGPIGVAIDIVADHFNALRKVAIDVFGAIEGAIDSVEGAISGIIDAISRVVNALGSIHIPHIPGLSMAPAPAIAGFGRAAPTPTASSSSPVNINVYGAIDPEGTARTILRVLQGHERRQGRLAV